MAIKHMNDIPKEAVQGGTGAFRQVLIGPGEGPNFAMRRFIIEPGGGIPLHTNSVEHEQLVLNGRAEITIGDESYEVKKNDVVFIPSGVRHSYKVVGDTAFEFLCVVPNKPDTMVMIRQAGSL